MDLHITQIQNQRPTFKQNLISHGNPNNCSFKKRGVVTAKIIKAIPPVNYFRLNQLSKFICGQFFVLVLIGFATSLFQSTAVAEGQASEQVSFHDSQSSVTQHEQDLEQFVEFQANEFSTASVVSGQTSVDENTASGVDYTAPENIIIYGGYAGSTGECASPSGTNICNSCIGGNSAPTTVCNTGTNFACAEKSIYDGLTLSLSMTLNTLPSNAVVRAELTPSGGAKTTLSIQSGTTTPTAANQAFTVKLSWTDICSKVGLTTCQTQGARVGDLKVGIAEGSAADLASGNYQTFTIKVRSITATGISTVSPPTPNPTSSNLGVTDFTMLPGDEKAYIRDIVRDGNTPSDSSISYWKSLKVFASSIADNGNDFCNIDLSTAPYAVLDFSDKKKDASEENSLTKEFLDGLVNETTYLFVGASVDDTSIVQSFIDPSTGTAAQQLQYTATPGEVIGLLDKQKCFVATAAFGSPMNNHVQNLRNFRDRFLLKNYFGKRFVRFYYLNSTSWARYIEDHPALKPVVRAALWPFVMTAELSLAIGFFPTLILVVSFFTAIALLIRRFLANSKSWNQWRNL